MTKKLKSIFALALSFALVITAASGCSSECEHDVSKWTVKTPATCTDEGVEEGICALCGETQYRTIPIDEDNHSYGDWEITVPTEKRVGSAIKTCEYNSDHRLRVNLPVLSDSLYTSTVTKRPTVNEPGIRTYTYPHEEGDIVFTVEISNTGITSVRDAVEVSCDSVGHSSVRSGTGTVSNAYYDSGTTASSSSSYSYSYKYGENFTYIDDLASDSSERWYSVDSDGEIYGYCIKNGEGYEETKTTSGSEEYINGYRYVFVYSTFVGTYYGTENFILGLYTAARQNDNGDFTEDYYTSNGETLYKFSYGMVNPGSTGYFATVEVEFTLTDEYTIKSCTATCTTYVNADGDESWFYDDEGNAYVKYATGMHYISSFTLTQTTKTEDPDEPYNKYDADSMKISDFDIIYNDTVDSNGNYIASGDKTLDDDGYIDGEPIKVTATYPTYSSYEEDGLDENEDPTKITSYTYSFRVENVTPDTMANNVSDDLVAYYRSYTNSDKTKYVDYELSVYTGSATGVGVAYYYSTSSNSFFFTINIAGEVDIVLKTSKTEKIIHFEVAAVAPSTLYPMIYKYSTTGYTWNSSYTEAVTTEVYAGQNVYFSSEVPTTESKYADSGYTISVTSAVDGEGNEISSEYYSYEQEGLFYSQYMSWFSATKAGTYVITLTSTAYSEKTSTITVTVKEVPDVSDLFSGSYSTTVSYGYGKVTITFEEGEESGVYYAQITSNKAVETLKCVYNGVTLVSEHYAGDDNGFSLALNEAYDLVFTYSTGVTDDNGGYLTETKVLTTG